MFMNCLIRGRFRKRSERDSPALDLDFEDHLKLLLCGKLKEMQWKMVGPVKSLSSA